MDQVDQYSCRCSFCFSSFETNIYLAKKQYKQINFETVCKRAAPSSSSERGAEREMGANRTGLSVVKNWNNKAEQEADFKSQSSSLPLHLRSFHFQLAVSLVWPLSRMFILLPDKTVRDCQFPMTSSVDLCHTEGPPPSLPVFILAPWPYYTLLISWP